MSSHINLTSEGVVDYLYSAVHENLGITSTLLNKAGYFIGNMGYTDFLS